jgi:hypothetical protein
MTIKNDIGETISSAYISTYDRKNIPLEKKIRTRIMKYINRIVEEYV